MSVKVSWYDEENQILHYRFDGAWTWEEYYAVLPLGREMMKDVQHMVCILNDMRNTDIVPTAFLDAAQSVISTTPPNTGLVVFVSTNYVFQTVFRTFVRIYPHLTQLYRLESDLYEAVHKQREWLKSNGHARDNLPPRQYPPPTGEGDASEPNPDGE